MEYVDLHHEMAERISPIMDRLGAEEDWVGRDLTLTLGLPLQPPIGWLLVVAIYSPELRKRYFQFVGLQLQVDDVALSHHIGEAFRLAREERAKDLGEATAGLNGFTNPKEIPLHMRNMQVPLLGQGPKLPTPTTPIESGSPTGGDADTASDSRGD
jgi:hypothetical protein